MRGWAAILLAASVAAPVSVAAPLKLDEWAGVYKRPFGNADVEGRQFTSVNVLEIVKLTSGSAYIRAETNAYNGHLCIIAGVADAKAGHLIYRPPAEDGDEPCELTIDREKDQLVLHDRGLNCRVGRCGMRAGLDGWEFAVKSRRPIRYMTRLKKSEDFIEALAEHENR